ncbi:hypothetical protein T484DRAFT_1797559, partial [Baffinella frigidus]
PPQYRPRSILLADRSKGGNGVSLQARKVFAALMDATRFMAYEVFAALMDAARLMVKSCTCDNFRGCPACVQMLSCAENNRVLDK